ncbi:MAG: hypothetical protein U0176_24685 [Bacteroidia bacterium]
MTVLLLASCRKERFTDCPSDVDLLESYTIDGKEVAIYADGRAYLVKRDECRLEEQYFEPDFLATHYRIDSNGLIRTDDGLTRTDISTTSRATPTSGTACDERAGHRQVLVTFTAQSPDNPEIEDYGTRPMLPRLLHLRFHRQQDGAHPRTRQIRQPCAAVHRRGTQAQYGHLQDDSPLPYFVKGMDLWFQADYKIEGAYPYSLVDFENPFFESSPGPRLVIDGDGALAMENKFGEKLKFHQANPRPLSLNNWVTIKVHLYLSNTDDGRFEVWQGGLQVLDVQGRNLPTYHSVQSSLEVGISATDVGTTLLLDNVRISDVAF